MNHTAIRNFVFMRLCGFLFLCSGLSHNLYAQSSYLSADDVLKNVTKFFPQIKIARLEIDKARGDLLSSYGYFDPSINVNAKSQPVGGYINNYANSEISVPTLYNGLRVYAGYRNGQGDWPVYYQNFLTNSGGEYRVGLTLPLLRDRLIDKERTKLITNSQNIKMREEEAALTKIQIYQESIKAYWQWVEAGLQLKYFEQLVTLAKVRQKAIEKQVKEGALPRLAIAENLQQIVKRQQLQNQGQMVYEQAAVNLSLYYRDDRGRPQVPINKQLPIYMATKDINKEKSELNLRCHPALKRLEIFRDITIQEKRLAQNELLPDLDFRAYTAKQFGTGGYPLLLPQMALVGVVFKFPIYQREARGKVVRLTNELFRVRMEKHFLFEKLKNELENLFIGVQTFAKQVKLLEKELGYAKKVQEGETKKFFEGDSTLFLVNQREQATAQTQLNLIDATVRYNELNYLAYFFSST